MQLDPIRITEFAPRVEGGREVVGFGEESAIPLQFLSVDVTSIHPEVEAFIADELRHANRFINGGVLSLRSVQFVLGDQHCPLQHHVSDRVLILPFA